jgi:phosphoribosylanthranilate isomerase
MFIKICGMRNDANIQEVARLKPDLMGFIFYPKSKRFVGRDFDPALVQALMPEISTVGVFVNDNDETVLTTARKYQFDYVQLHGNESPQFCKQIQNEGFRVLKAFGMNAGFEADVLEPYADVCDYFLFDTSTSDYGGSGQKFDWELLHRLHLSKPFVLSGGIGPEDAERILAIRHPLMAGIDINSRFETEPAMKDVQKLSAFIHQLKR